MIRKIDVRKLPIEERRKLKHEALMLRKTMSIAKIVATLNISRSTVEGWIYKNRNPDNLFNHPKLHSSKELSYILGVLYGDGCVTTSGKGAYVIKLATTSLIFALEFKEALERIGLNPRIDIEMRSRKNSRLKDRYVVRAFSKIFYSWYKSVSLDILREIIKGGEIDFLRGFYESEGSIDLRRKKGQLRIRITNTNRELLELVKNIIEKNVGISCNIQKRKGTKKPAFEIVFEGNKKCLRFLEVVRPSIKNYVEEKW